ncbi:1-acyl-sn-glycerol-3-phosphate acyltransferases [Reichenbachiella faecimaris]|uniref:1-acyl-sn-glycerol-3-phosphate acyltransferases n=1 Tax=Reichenbachiella faecimaris TaxID=692418 RepID=A0A1W2G683_REIFA|nr:trifunctional MMPL family transporter/lysophospholipid acyltransferase/class I SAM-dependent methyltransferase [Reichenbachiella faecimaris]SMD32189.1 1-acyl-sn-glycerol-3-phosphate acyltransferases [Reichenbachiella faecimaris]
MRRLHQLFLFFFVLMVIIGGSFSIFKINIGENLDETIPGATGEQGLSALITQNKKSIAFAISGDASWLPEQYESLADELILQIDSLTRRSIANWSYRSDIDSDDFAEYFYHHLPLYLDSLDYVNIDHELTAENIQKKLADNKRMLLSPEGFGIKKWLIADPLHLLPIALNKAKSTGHGSTTLNSQGLFLSKTGDQIFLYGELTHDISDSKQNHLLAEQLAAIQSEWQESHPYNPLSYFGTFLIADANATQIKKDIAVTVTIAVIFIIALLLYYYRSPVILLLFLLPGAFGVLFALGTIYLIQNQLSGLAMGASAVIFGIVADYSFHFFAQFKHTRHAVHTRNQILFPLSTSAVTTIMAFLSLLFAQSQALHDFGLLTSLSLAGTLFFVLMILPYLLKPFQAKFNFDRTNRLDQWMEKIDIQDQHVAKPMLWTIIMATILFAYFASDVEFEDDLNKLNFYPESLKKDERALQNIDPDLEKRLTIVANHADLKEAIQTNFLLDNKLKSDELASAIHSQASLALFLIPESEQQKRITRWNNFWNSRKKKTILTLQEAAAATGFNAQAFSSFIELLNSAHEPTSFNELVSESETLQKLFIQNENSSTLITSVVCNVEQVGLIKSELNQLSHVTVLDESGIVSRLIEAVRADFNYLLLFASMAVFIAMLIVYGSLELTLISFLPMVISWVWILGLSALLEIKFNFINIIIATFIFGLGDDFSIFITDGLREKYKSGQKVLSHYKTGIILSAISTIVGTGVLIFARHPALRSIAALSVLGIVIIAFVAFFVQPIFFRFFITARVQKGKPPMTLLGLLIGGLNFICFAMGCLLSILLCYGVRLIPFISAEIKKYWVHIVIQRICQIQMALIVTVKRRDFGFENLDFDKPSILIANHTTFKDILTLLRLHPKLVLMVNEWVYHSPLFGKIIRYADFLPAFEGMEKNLDQVRALTKKGYSVGIFPEGTRSVEGKIGRFHKGAFYLAKELQLDITPVLLHGLGYALPKNDFYLKNGFVDVTVLPRIAWNDPSVGPDYRTMAKAVSKAFKKAHKDRLMKPDMAGHAYDPLLGSFRYKDPVTEWYFRIKWKFEKENYEQYNQLIGTGAKKVYDLGCGMGYLSHFLLLRESERTIVGVDFDEEKIALAQHSYLTNNKITFEAEDVSLYKPTSADAIILADVLHYLSEEQQVNVLNQCLAGLNENGILLIRDGLADVSEKHAWTEKSEKWSTKIIKFNKTSGDLHFFSQTFLEDWASQNGRSITLISQSEQSSNALFLVQ